MGDTELLKRPLLGTRLSFLHKAAVNRYTVLVGKSTSINVHRMWIFLVSEDNIALRRSVVVSGSSFSTAGPAPPELEDVSDNTTHRLNSANNKEKWTNQKILLLPL